MMFFALVITASAFVKQNSLRYKAQTVPRLQTEQVFHDDFVHDDTLHPEEAVKLNIVESENRLKEAEKALEGMKDKYEAAKKKKEGAEKVHSDHSEVVQHAQEQVSHYNASLAGMGSFSTGLEAAEAVVVTAKDAANQSDIAATAAAETVKQAQEDLHESIMTLVDAKDNVTAAEQNVSDWQAKIDEATSANASLAEWQQKLNDTLEHDTELAGKASEAGAAYDEVHGEWKALEARFFDAQKMFDADQADYEEHVGPYPPEKKKEENLWIDALTSGDWHMDWSR